MFLGSISASFQECFPFPDYTLKPPSNEDTNAFFICHLESSVSHLAGLWTYFDSLSIRSYKLLSIIRIHWQNVYMYQSVSVSIVKVFSSKSLKRYKKVLNITNKKITIRNFK